jgi:hypothetical protein
MHCWTLLEQQKTFFFQSQVKQNSKSVLSTNKDFLSKKIKSFQGARTNYGATIYFWNPFLNHTKLMPLKFKSPTKGSYQIRVVYYSVKPPLRFDIFPSGILDLGI